MLRLGRRVFGPNTGEKGAGGDTGGMMAATSHESRVTSHEDLMPPIRLSRMCLTAACALAVAVGAAPVSASDDTLRIAVFNIRELTASKIDAVDENGRGVDPQLSNAGSVVAEVAPDVLVVQEIDYVPGRDLPLEFWRRYVDPGAEGGDLFQVYLPVNTGVPSALDLDRNGQQGDPEDAWGFGRYPGQYGMALISRRPIDVDGIRTFRGLRWITMPGHLMPDGRDGRPSWYDAEAAALLRLSSKSHWDVPIRVGGDTLHLLISHPTPPVFDGDEDRNGRRNHDEIRFWADYVSTTDVASPEVPSAENSSASGSGEDRASYIVDDRGRRGGLEPGASFVVIGDLNADPHARGPIGAASIRQLLDHPRIVDPAPRAVGPQPTERSYAGDPGLRTAAYGRLDYLLPSRELTVEGSGIFLPPENDPRRRWIDGQDRASDHQLVWLDLLMKGPR